MTVQITSKGATLTYGNEGLVADNPKDVRTHRNVVYVCMQPREEKRYSSGRAFSIRTTNGASELLRIGQTR